MDDKEKKKLKKVAKKQVLSKVQKEKILKDAKGVREKLDKEAKKYKTLAKKQSEQTARFYDRAAQIVKEQAREYTQKVIRSQFGKDVDINARVLAEAQFLKSFSKGNIATNVARRILSTRDSEGEHVTQSGARFYAGLKDIWYEPGLTPEEKSEAYKMRDKKIMQAFGKKNLLEVMELLEEKLNMNLIEMLQSPEDYEKAKLAIANYVAEHREELGL